MLTLRSIVSEFQGKYAGTEYARECYRTPEQRIILDAAAAIEELMTVHVPAIVGLCERAADAPLDPTVADLPHAFFELESALASLRAILRRIDRGGGLESLRRHVLAFGFIAPQFAALLTNHQYTTENMSDFLSRYEDMVREWEAREAYAAGTAPRVW